MNFYKKIFFNFILFLIVTFNFNNIFAEETKIEKEEVIYVNLDYNGNVKNINVVNIFNNNNITDYGNYSNIKNLHSEDKINLNKDKITSYSEKENITYQGTMKNKSLPWNISIKYLIDEKEYKKNDIVGKNGNLKIKISINKNENFKKSFWRDFSLQVILNLNGEKFKNIKSKGATIVNAGKNKQLIYTVMPKENFTAEIFANVEDFELEPIQISGIKLNLDNFTLLNKSKEVKNNVFKIINGTNELKYSSEKIKDGILNFKNATSNFKNGTLYLNDGIVKIETNMYKLQEGLDILKEKSDILKESSLKIKYAIKDIDEKTSQYFKNIVENTEDLYKNIYKLKENICFKEFKNNALKNNLNIEKIQNNNIETISNINNKIKLLEDNLNNETQEKEIIKLKSQIEEFKNIIKLINLNNETINFTETYLNFINSNLSLHLDKIKDLKNMYNNFNNILENISISLEKITSNTKTLSNCINTLYNQYNSLNEGFFNYIDNINNITLSFKEINKGIEEISKGSIILKDNSNNMFLEINKLDNNFNKFHEGIVQFNKEINNLKNKTDNKLDNILNCDYNKITESFTSEKNKNVTAVQFIMKTEYIEKEIIKKETTSKKDDITFFKKLKNLFKKD